MAMMEELTFNCRAKGSITAFTLAFGKQYSNSIWCSDSKRSSKEHRKSAPGLLWVRSFIHKILMLKVKVIPRQAEVDEGVPSRLRPQIFSTFRHYKGGRSSAKFTGRLYPRRKPWYSLSEADSTSRGSTVPRKISPVTPPGIDPVTVRLVAEFLNHYATPGLKSSCYLLKFQVL